MAEAGLERLTEISRHCRLPQHLRDVGVPRGDLGHLAGEAMKVTRLLKNNPREIAVADALGIYEAAF